jgi:hypothetical protein
MESKQAEGSWTTPPTTRDPSSLPLLYFYKSELMCIRCDSTIVTNSINLLLYCLITSKKYLLLKFP